MNLFQKYLVGEFAEEYEEGRITRRLSRILNIRPQRRIRKRVLLPPTLRASARRLRAVGIALVHNMPARWFLRGKKGGIALPRGAELLDSDAKGQPFIAKGQRGRNVFRRGSKRRTAQAGAGGLGTHLPIKEQFVDTAPLGNSVLGFVIQELAREFPGRFQRRMGRELRRIYGS